MSKRPFLIIIAGPNGSGKTSITSKLLTHDWLENSVYTIDQCILVQAKTGMMPI